MKKVYKGQNVFEALQQRLRFIFEEFDNIIVSFSGGKDSGLLLDLTLDFQKKYYSNKKTAVFIRILKRNTALPPSMLRKPSKE